MASFEIVLRDQTIERVDGADAYVQEGQLTTFFATDDGRRIIDSWSTRLASIRTTEVLVVRRLEDGRRPEAPHRPTQAASHTTPAAPVCARRGA